MLGPIFRHCGSDPIPNSPGPAAVRDEGWRLVGARSCEDCCHLAVPVEGKAKGRGRVSPDRRDETLC